MYNLFRCFCLEWGENEVMYNHIKCFITSFASKFKLKQKFQLLYLIGIVVPVIIVDSLVIFNIKTYQEKEVQQALENSVAQTLSEFSSIMEQVAYLSRNIVSDTSLVTFLSNTYTSDEEYQKAYEEIRNKSVLNYYKFIKEVSNITIYVENDTVRETSNIKILNEETRKLWWYQKYRASGESCSIFEDTSKGANSTVNPHAGMISLVRKFTNTYGRECIVVLDLNYNQIHHAVLSEKNKADVYICNGNKILFASDTRIFKVEKKEVPTLENIKFDKLFVKRIVPVVTENWVIYAMRNKESFLSAIVNSKDITLLMLVINLLLPSLVINGIVKSMLSRLRILDQHFDWLNSERLEKIPEDTKKDEISQLFSHYNSCVDKIQELINTIVEKNDEKHALEATKKQAELNALNTQVNPHFMYNTLECICMRSMLKGENETADIVRCLSVLLRQMSKWDKDVVPIEEEFDFVQKYLTIQKYRFAEKITYEIKLEDGAKDLIIPKLTLVSFVENACVHGIEESLESGDVCVGANVEHDKVLIVVKDTGCGMNEDKLNELRNKIEEADVNMLYHSKSTGVLNAVLRLKMYFGDRLSFAITSAVDEGTQIEIRIEQKFR